MINGTDHDSTANVDDESGDSGDGGEGGTGSGSTGFIPDYDQLFAVTAEEAEIARCAKEGVFSQRVSLKSQGEKVAALDKLQELRKKMSDPRVATELINNGGSDLATHPELEDLGGAFNFVVFPESEAEAAANASNDPQLRNELRARLTAGLSMGSAREELKNKEKMKMGFTPAPAPPKPSYRPTLPKPRPY